MEVKEISECADNAKKLIVIQYPGVISSVDNMLKTLGGTKTINEVHKDTNRRLELNFRPGNIYCRPTCGERHPTTGLLVKITRRKKKPKFIKPGDNTIVKSTLIGMVNMKYSFENFCDFQYLPVVKKTDSTDYDCLNDLIPSSIVPSKWLEEDFPLFLPPAVFTRMDIPQDYFFRNDVKDDQCSNKRGVLYRTRQKRKHYAILTGFNSKELPMEPLPQALEQIRGKAQEEQLYSNLVDIFKERPMWSKNAIKGKYGFSSEKLTVVLPCIAFYFKTGPWGKLWTRFGYDPRNYSTSWLYQTFDFRLRQSGGAKSHVKAKRRTMDYLLPYKNINASKRKRSVVRPLNITATDEYDESRNKEPEEDNPDRLYVFREDSLPLYRQMFYQYCDIDVPEVQKILEDSILSLSKPVCNEKTGWLPAGIDAKCRDCVSKLVEKTLLDKCVDPSFIDDGLSAEDSDELDE